MPSPPIDLCLRPATAADVDALRRLYAAAVADLGPTAYTPDQVAAWRGFADAPGFAAFVLDVHTYLALVGGETAGFCGISDAGHVASIYVAPDRARQGIGRALLDGVMRRHPLPTSGRFHAEASLFSLGLFESLGFRRCGREVCDRGGVSFERLLVERPVVPAG